MSNKNHLYLLKLLYDGFSFLVTVPAVLWGHLKLPQSEGWLFYCPFKLLVLFLPATSK